MPDADAVEPWLDLMMGWQAALAVGLFAVGAGLILGALGGILRRPR